MNYEIILNQIKEVAPNTLDIDVKKTLFGNYIITVGILHNDSYISYIDFVVPLKSSDLKIKINVDLNKWNELELLSSMKWYDFMRFSHFVKSKYVDFLI